jgi:hypothetical protein
MHALYFLYSLYSLYSRYFILQIQMMLVAGAVREQGVVEAIRGGEYGFIKPADRPNQIYFRLDDFVDREMRVSEVGPCNEMKLKGENRKGLGKRR